MVNGSRAIFLQNGAESLGRSLVLDGVYSLIRLRRIKLSHLSSPPRTTQVAIDSTCDDRSVGPVLPSHL